MRTIHEIITELESNKVEAQARNVADARKKTELEATVAASTEAMHAALTTGDQAAYDRALREKQFADAALRLISERLPYYTSEQVEAYQREIDCAEHEARHKYKEEIRALLEEIRQLEEAADREINEAGRLHALLCDTQGKDHSRGICIHFPTSIPRLPSDYYHKITR